MPAQRSAGSSLADWLRKEKLSLRAAGRRLDVDHAQVARLISGERKPGQRLARRLQQLAGIPVESWGWGPRR